MRVEGVEVWGIVWLRAECHMARPTAGGSEVETWAPTSPPPPLPPPPSQSQSLDGDFVVHKPLNPAQQSSAWVPEGKCAKDQQPSALYGQQHEAVQRGRRGSRSGGWVGVCNAQILKDQDHGAVCE